MVPPRTGNTPLSFYFFFSFYREKSPEFSDYFQHLIQIIHSGHWTETKVHSAWKWRRHFPPRASRLRPNAFSISIFLLRHAQAAPNDKVVPSDNFSFSPGKRPATVNLRPKAFHGTGRNFILDWNSLIANIEIDKRIVIGTWSHFPYRRISPPAGSLTMQGWETGFCLFSVFSRFFPGFFRFFKW